MSNSPYFRLFPSCRLVNGDQLSVIADLDRGRMIDIPNLMLEVFQHNQKEKLTVNQLKGCFEHKYDEGIDRIIDFLLKEKLGFFTYDPGLFEDIDLNFEIPYSINNAIIEYAPNSPFQLETIISVLNEHGCQAIELRFLENHSEATINEVLAKSSCMRIKKIDLFLKYTENTNVELFPRSLFGNYPRIGSIVFYSSPKNMVRSERFYNRFISLTSTNLELLKLTEKKSRHSFVCNLTAFTEAQSFNLGLNKKLSINRFGKIKNYLSHNAEYGDASKENILMYLQNVEILKTWSISNDEIEICKACQYRYGCVDNSAIVSRNGKFFKDQFCNYDPFQNKWI